MFKLISYIVVLIIIGVFILLNSSQRVALNLLFTSFHDAPLAIVCLLFLIFGLVVSIPFFFVDRIALLKKHSVEQRRLEAHLESARNEVRELEKELAKRSTIKE